MITRLKGQEDYQKALEKIAEATMKAHLEFEAFGDLGALLEANFTIAQIALLEFLRIFGEGHPIVVQARDDLIAASQALETLRTGQTRYAAVLKGADKDIKKQEEVWRKLGSTLEEVGSQMGEAFGNMILGMKTSKEQFKEILKEMLKQLIAFVVKAVVQFIILSAFGGGGGNIGQQIGTSIGAGLGNSFVTSVPPATKAQGGVLTRPTVTRLAERGAEAVVPLQNGSIPVNLHNMDKESSRSGEQVIDLTIINVSSKNEADRIAKDKQAIINVVNADMEARGSIFRTVKAVSRSR